MCALAFKLCDPVGVQRSDRVFIPFATAMEDLSPSTPTYRSMNADVDPGGPTRISIPRAPHDEAVFSQTRIDIAPSMVDLVLCMDCTGSMGQYIREAKESASRIAHVLRHEHGLDLRVGFAPYRDHPPGELTFASKRFPLSPANDQLYEYLCGPEATAQGGGDGPEAVEMGLFDALHMKWRSGATKLCFLIGDAPPHGLGEPKDDFPDGSPQGIDPIGVLDEMASKGIRVYALACEPSIAFPIFGEISFKMLLITARFSAMMSIIARQ